MTLRDLFETLFPPTCVSVVRFGDTQTDSPAKGVVKYGGVYSMELEPYIDDAIIAIDVKYDESDTAWATTWLEIVVSSVGKK